MHERIELFDISHHHVFIHFYIFFNSDLVNNVYQFICCALLFQNLVLVHCNPEGAPVEHAIIIGVVPPGYGNLG